MLSRRNSAACYFACIRCTVGLISQPGIPHWRANVYISNASAFRARNKSPHRVTTRRSLPYRNGRQGCGLALRSIYSSALPVPCSEEKPRPSTRIIIHLRTASSFSCYDFISLRLRIIPPNNLTLPFRALADKRLIPDPSSPLQCRARAAGERASPQYRAAARESRLSFRRGRFSPSSLLSTRWRLKLRERARSVGEGGTEFRLRREPPQMPAALEAARTGARAMLAPVAAVILATSGGVVCNAVRLLALANGAIFGRPRAVRHALRGTPLGSRGGSASRRHRCGADVKLRAQPATTRRQKIGDSSSQDSSLHN